MISSARRRDPGLERIATNASQGLARAITRTAARAWEPIVFSLTMNGPLPDRLHALPHNPRPGRIECGHDLMKGRYAFAGAALDLPRRQVWGAAEMASPGFREALHGFGWLADLAALDRRGDGSSAARETARELFADWSGAQTDYSELAWRPDIVGRRVMSWLCEAPLLAEGSDTYWRMKFYQALAWHARYLNHTAEHARPGKPRLTALLGLVLVCLALGDAGPRRQRASTRLIEELAQQIRGDGGHISRSPSAQLDILADLLIVKDAFVQSNTPMPAELQAQLGKMIAMLQLLHMGEGRLAFDGGASDPETVGAILSGSDTSTGPASDAPDSGFHRMSAEDNLMLVDAGPPCQDRAAQFGIMSFELAAGTRGILGPSGLQLGETSLKPSDSALIQVHRHDELAAGYGGTWLDLAHDGQGSEHGRKITRRLYLQERGGDVRGADTITPTLDIPLEATPYTARFQLHPDVEAEVESGSVKLAVAGGENWRFKCRGAEPSLADAVHHGPSGARPSRQIVLEGIARQEPVAVRWALKREAGERETAE